jgi:hypothetical protein
VPIERIVGSGEGGDQQVARQEGVAGGANLLRRSARETTVEEYLLHTLIGISRMSQRDMPTVGPTIARSATVGKLDAES